MRIAVNTIFPLIFYGVLLYTLCIEESPVVQQKAIDLFHAYSQNIISREGACIVSSLFDPDSGYAKYEFVAYKKLQAVYLSAAGLSLQTDGNKLYILVEPADYAQKAVEPFKRTKDKQIPHRFSELEIFTTRKRSRIMVSKKPVMVYSSFTVPKPANDDFAFLFYNLPDVLDSIASFLTKTMVKENGLNKEEAAKVVPLILRSLKKFNVWAT
jgi:hypothetical protein